MRKVLVLMVIYVFMISCLGVAHAAPPDNLPEIPVGARIVYERLPLEDTDILLARAKAGITDLPGDVELVRDSISCEPGAMVEKYVTSQKLREVRWLEGGIERYLTTAIVFVTLPEEYVEKSDVTVLSDAGILSTQTAYDSKTDPSVSWKVELWFTYENQWDALGKTYGKITQVRAKWTRYDSQVVANASMLAAALGTKLGGGYNNKVQYNPTTGTFNPTSGQNYYLHPPNWGHTLYLDEAGMNILFHYIAGAVRTELVRGSSKWRLDLDIVKGDRGSFSY